MMAPRLQAPSAQRNREPILAVLKAVLPSSGTILEIASGSGEHVIHFARALPDLTFQPSDINPANLESISAWVSSSAVPNVLPPIQLDVTAGNWPLSADAVLCINMIHISPWEASVGLIQGAARILATGAPLYLYGPYRRGGAHTADSNRAFDADLRSRNPAWGVRDLEAVSELAAEAGFSAPRIVEMPANNLSVIFERL
ncbi:DUF938 domain-containing protein [Dongia sp.]|uniref:DUF938 domain-containing protein n=1 Tax=Dongia sp. TaxID=1977262 RepID=UPI0035AF9D01